MKPTRILVDGAAWILTAAVLIFLLAPVLLVVPVSFNDSAMIRFPPGEMSLRWYRDFLEDPEWREAISTSARLVLVVGAITTLLAIVTVHAVETRLPAWRRAVRLAVLAPLFTPGIVTCIVLFEATARLSLAGSFWGLVVGHVVMALPLAYLLVENAFATFDRNLEEAARTLGAGPFRALNKVVVPLLLPALAGAILFSMLTSLEEVVFVNFVGGTYNQTISSKMFNFLETEIRPTIAAISSILLAFGLLSTLGLKAWQRRRSLSPLPRTDDHHAS